MRFRHRIGLLVALAALALTTVTAVTLILGQRNEEQLSGIETRYVPLLELDRDLASLFAEIPRALEDAASAAEEAKLDEVDALVEKLVVGLQRGARTITDNGGDPAQLERELRAYYRSARAVSSALVHGDSAAQLTTEIEAMLEHQKTFSAHLDKATSLDRRELAAAFAAARSSQRTSLKIDILVAFVALALMTLLSWQITRKTVRSLQEVSLGVERLARGEFDHEIVVRTNDELGDLAIEANRTAKRLRDYHARGEREDWIKTGIAELTTSIAGELAVTALGGNAMRYLATYTGARAAVVHAVVDGATRRLDAGGSVPDDVTALAPAAVAAVLSAHDVRVEESPEYGHVVVIPLLFESTPMGVLELAMAAAPAERTLDLLTRIRGVVGVALRVAESRERTRTLLLETQRQAAAAEAANKELESFSYSVSHDLRAPLRGIDGFSQSLVEDFADAIPPRGQDYLRRIRAAAQRMAELIDDLLQLSRVGRSELHRQPIDLSAIAVAVIAELRRTDPERVVDVRIADDVRGVADARLIRIVLENLLGNAWKFSAKTPQAEIELTVRQDGDETAYCVRDNGAGFDMKYVDKLFGAFQRLHSEKEFPGTGIGLATVQRIVRRHGGRIWVDAAVGKGATFCFTLPPA